MTLTTFIKYFLLSCEEDHSLAADELVLVGEGIEESKRFYLLGIEWVVHFGEVAQG